MTVMEAAFLITGLVCALVCVLSVRRVLIVIGLVRRGERVQGWCARRRMFALNANDSHFPQFTFAFRTPAGEVVEFRDRPGAFGYEEGAPVRVCYDPARPHKRATVAGPDTWGPVYVWFLIALPTGLLAFVTLTTLAAHWGLT